MAKEKKIDLEALISTEVWLYGFKNLFSVPRNVATVEEIKSIIDEGVKSAIENYSILSQIRYHTEQRKKITDALLEAVKIILELKLVASDKSIDNIPNYETQSPVLRKLLEDYYRETAGWVPP